MSYSLEHIVFLSLKDNLSDQDLDKINENIQRAKTIPGVVDITLQKNLCPIKNGGFNNIFKVVFQDPTDYENFKTHPLHLELSSSFMKFIVDGNFIIGDYLIPKVN
ncbi:hypothetical protein CYY_005844 [Polysphondylium violaceum]|uniref:Stress-response A/B barrel domain-containing protein n=1 Tax=Polysphondylium violaceum TaxID=133409 RepID=A0A8J4PS83_9MYCE|nr:hypothetical protein CYY_005844 [Polysphondylium violaceum]